MFIGWALFLWLKMVVMAIVYIWTCQKHDVNFMNIEIQYFFDFFISHMCFSKKKIKLLMLTNVDITWIVTDVEFCFANFIKSYLFLKIVDLYKSFSFQHHHPTEKKWIIRFFFPLKFCSISMIRLKSQFNFIVNLTWWTLICFSNFIVFFIGFIRIHRHSQSIFIFLAVSHALIVHSKNSHKISFVGLKILFFAYGQSVSHNVVCIPSQPAQRSPSISIFYRARASERIAVAIHAWIKVEKLFLQCSKAWKLLRILCSSIMSLFFLSYRIWTLRVRSNDNNNAFSMLSSQYTMFVCENQCSLMHFCERRRMSCDNNCVRKHCDLVSVAL